MGSPGPATISLTAAGSTYGLRRSLGYLAGIVVGTALVLVAVATGITAALLAVPAMRPVLIAVSAAYILWLAYKVATAPALAAGPRAARPRSPAARSSASPTRRRGWRSRPSSRARASPPLRPRTRPRRSRC
jgi:threonine/homoserine/homoserine lactone efflux protein